MEPGAGVPISGQWSLCSTAGHRSVIEVNPAGKLGVDNQFKAGLENLSKRKVAELGESPRGTVCGHGRPTAPGNQGARCHLLVCVTGSCEKLLPW